MKLLLAIAFTVLFTSQILACEDVGIFGKVFNPQFETIKGAELVIFVSDADVYVTGIERGGYSISLPGCTSFRAGILSTPGYYFRTARFATPSEAGSGLLLNFVGTPIGTGRGKSTDIDRGPSQSLLSLFDPKRIRLPTRSFPCS